MMSCYEGLLELYKVTKNPLYLSVVEKTMNHIINEEINVLVPVVRSSAGMGARRYKLILLIIRWRLV